MSLLSKDDKIISLLSRENRRSFPSYYLCLSGISGGVPEMAPVTTAASWTRSLNSSWECQMKDYLSLIEASDCTAMKVPRKFALCLNVGDNVRIGGHRPQLHRPMAPGSRNRTAKSRLLPDWAGSDVKSDVCSRHQYLAFYRKLGKRRIRIKRDPSESFCGILSLRYHPEVIYKSTTDKQVSCI